MSEAATRTKDRLRAAASALFAERGFHATTIRDIAQRAGVNVAAGNYHYGSKKELYLEVLRGEFAQIQALLAQRGASPSAAVLDRLGRPGLEALLRARAQVMLDMLIGPPPGLHGTLMQREMCDPSEALPVIVAEFIRPWMRELEAIVSRLQPQLDAAAVERCAMSIVGQALFYRFTMPAVLQMQGRRTYARRTAGELAAHITEFSLGGFARVARARRGRARAR